MALAETRSAPFATVATGDRIMVELEDTLVEVDVDGGQGRVVEGSGVLGMVGVGRSVVFVDRSKAKVAEAGNRARPRVLGDADEVWSRHDGRSVWLVTVDEGEEHGDEKATLTPVDVAGGQRSAEAWTVDGQVVAASSRYVAVADYSARGSRVEVWDAERRAVVHRIPNGEVFELVGTTMVWQAFDRRALNTGAGVPPVGPVHVTDLVTGNDRTFTGPPGAGAGVVMVSPDRSKLAVLWNDDVTVLALDNLREVASVALSGNRFASSVTWSADGRRLWLSLDDVEGDGVLAVLDLATRRLEELPLRGVIYDVAAF